MPQPKQTKGYLARRPGIASHILPHAQQLHERARRYFNIDLSRLPQMSDQELAQYADRAIAMKRLREILPILEKHFTELIEGQVEYEQFIQRVLKQVEKGSKTIDKSLLDAWLVDRGYTKHLALMNQKAGLGAQKQDAELRSETNLNQMDFNSAIRMIHLRHQRQRRQIQEKVPRAIREQQIQEQLRQQSEQRRELLTYGTQGKPGKGFWQGFRDFVGL